MALLEHDGPVFEEKLEEAVQHCHDSISLSERSTTRPPSVHGLKAIHDRRRKPPSFSSVIEGAGERVSFGVSNDRKGGRETAGENKREENACGPAASGDRARTKESARGTESYSMDYSDRIAACLVALTFVLIVGGMERLLAALPVQAPAPSVTAGGQHPWTDIP